MTARRAPVAPLALRFLAPLLLALTGATARAQTPLLTVPGNHAGDKAGAALAALPDLDGDGRNELVVGAPADGTPAAGRGEVRIVGSLSGGPLLRLLGADAADLFGAAVAGLPDVDGDLQPDLAVGAPHLAPGAGRVTLHSGATGAVLATLLAPGPDPGDSFGAALAALPDLDADGVADVFVGQPAAGGALAGSAYVFSGASGALLFAIVSPFGGGGGFGAAVALAGDVNADGTPDLVVGAPQAGAALLASGVDGAPLLVLSSGGGSFGAQVCGAGDLNADGRADVAVAAPGFNRVDVLSGSNGALLRRYQRDSGAFGSALAAAGDIDGDGVVEFLIGAPQDTVSGQPGAGGVYLVSGDTGVVQFKAPGPQAGGQQGAAVASIGSGPQADFAVGAPTAIGTGSEAGGIARLYDGALAGKIVPYGIGCPGSFLITPRLDLVGDPVPNGQLTISITKALGGSFALLFFGSGQGAVPLDNGCILWVDPTLPLLLNVPLSGSDPGAGTATLVGRLPPATPPGMVITMQALVSDPGTDGGIAATSAIQLTVL